MTSKNDFLKYEGVRVSGVTNMFAINVVMEISGLSRETVLDCMKNYANYTEKYITKGGEKNE